MARVPFVGIGLSEQHCKHLEIMLTDFVHEEMKKEGSAHYRPECCGTGAEEEDPQAGSKPKSANKSGVKNKQTSETGEEAKPKKKPKKTTPKEEEPAEPDGADGGGEDAGEGSPLPW